MDHGLIDGPIPGIESPIRAINQVIEGGIDAILTTPGIIGRFGQQLAAVPYILRIDGGQSTYNRGKGANTLISSVREAIRLGADAVAINGFIGANAEKEQTALFRKVALECSIWGVPLLAEMIPLQGEQIKNPFDYRPVATAARIGGELGADIIKTHYTGSKPSFKKVVDSSLVPVVIAGGPKIASVRDLLEMVEACIEAGGAGVAFGRNIWQHSNPKSMVRAIASIVHGGKSAGQAESELK